MLWEKEAFLSSLSPGAMPTLKLWFSESPYYGVAFPTPSKAAGGMDMLSRSAKSFLQSLAPSTLSMRDLHLHTCVVDSVYLNMACLEKELHLILLSFYEGLSG